MKDYATKERKERIAKAIEGIRRIDEAHRRNEEAELVKQADSGGADFFKAVLWGLFLSAAIVFVCTVLAGCSIKVEVRGLSEEVQGLESEDDRHQLDNIVEGSGELYEDDEMKN